jgi:hypothetical protein
VSYFSLVLCFDCLVLFDRLLLGLVGARQTMRDWERCKQWANQTNKQANTFLNKQTNRLNNKERAKRTKFVLLTRERAGGVVSLDGVVTREMICGKHLKRVTEIDVEAIKREFETTEVVLATDVRSPFVGPEGAVAV